MMPERPLRYCVPWLLAGTLCLADDVNATQSLLSRIETDMTLPCDKTRRYGLDFLRLMQVASLPGLCARMTESVARRYRHDRQYGCLDPDAVYPGAVTRDGGERNVTESLLLTRLYDGLARYGAILREGGWPQVPQTPRILKRGMRGAAVERLRKRLRVTGDLNASSLPGDDTFDAALKSAVIRFQIRHHLDTDGVVGPETRAALNVGVEARLAQIRYNIERLRWMTGPEADFVRVNIPAYEASVYRGGKPTLKMKAIVGRKGRPTPLVADTMLYAVLNPYWRAPRTIVAKDLLPRLKRKRFDYFKDHGIVASKDLAATSVAELDKVPWRRYDAINVPYYFIQPPGDKNYLGRMKFIFPNPLDVYIHDSPQKSLFERDEATFSSGCVRIREPIRFFETLFNPSGDNNWTEATITANLAAGEETIVHLDPPVRTYFLYQTVDVDENGTVRFYPDVYGYDRKMQAYLKTTSSPHF